MYVEREIYMSWGNTVRGREIFTERGYSNVIGALEIKSSRM